MKIIHISNSNHGGGAGRAVARIHKSLKSIGYNSKIWVNVKVGDDSDIITRTKKIYKIISMIKTFISRFIVSFLKTSNNILHSPQIFSSGWVKLINNSDADIIHLHAFNHEMLSISDISKIKKPIVWTLHDMWAFCGAEHISYDSRWIDGYNKKNRPESESGFDLNKWTWNRKKKYWNRPIQLIAPSKWMMDNVKQSKLMKNWPICEIFNPIDMSIWKPMDKKIAKDAFNLPHDVPLIMFGAFLGVSEYHKGYDLLEKALNHISSNKKLKNSFLVVFGQSEPKDPPKLKIPVIYLGRMYDDITLRMAYSAADLLVVPSRIDNAPLTASEAQACGTPVVAFNSTGLKTMVIHKKTGYLAKKFDIKDLAEGILWVIEKKDNELNINARKSAVERFSYSKVAKLHINIYKQILSNNL
tara:strand:+ start:15606 stop:16847 length:1242 start_codon:yes stop_codon:yes gene_type:complete